MMAEKEVKLFDASWYPPELIPKPVKVDSSKTGPAISIPSRVLTEAGIDISRVLYGRWLVQGDKIFLEISYEEKPGYTRLIRMDPSPTRLVYPPKSINATSGRFIWRVCGSCMLKLEPVTNTAIIKEFFGSAKMRDGILSAPKVFKANKCIVGVTTQCLVLIPDGLYGVSVSEKDDMIEINLRPIRTLLRRRGVEKSNWTCWEGKIEVSTVRGVLKGNCAILFPET